jgi:tetratricopeptide (TPR) repeat protein
MTETIHDAPRPSPFDEDRLRGIRCLESGDLDEALASFERSLDWARAHGTPAQVDLALCNRSGVLLELGAAADSGSAAGSPIEQGSGLVAELRAILLRNSEPENCFLAAYNVARAYQLRKENKKALFYARIALDRARLIERRDWLASSHNRIANILLAESYFDEACAKYEEALALLPDEVGVRQALILDNLGYCRIVQERLGEGFGHLFKSLRMLRRLGSLRWQLYPHLDLCFAYLEAGRLQRANVHGMRALTIAERFADREAIKNALYLLGEAANLAGRPMQARVFFGRLQNEFFPEEHYLPDFLLAIDVRKLINLKA